MGLSLRDMVAGTIVDHAGQTREDAVVVIRDVIRRGIIVKVDGNNRDSVTALWVKFKKDAEPEKVLGSELNIVYPANSRIAKEAYRRIVGAPRHVGAEFTVRRGVQRQKMEDSLALTAPKKNLPVDPPYDESFDESGMDLSDSQP